MFIAENETIGLRQYTHDDDYDMYLCWKDVDTQKGYNGLFNETFDKFRAFDIQRFKFWVTAVDKTTLESIGTLRLGLDEACPDLAIWIYPQYRHKGYGTASFKLALTYLFNHFPYEELSAGCYCDNLSSFKMLSNIGFRRYPEGDEAEISCFTGKPITQWELRLKRNDYLQSLNRQNLNVPSR